MTGSQMSRVDDIAEDKVKLQEKVKELVGSLDVWTRICTDHSVDR